MAIFLPSLAIIEHHPWRVVVVGYYSVINKIVAPNLRSETGYLVRVCDAGE